MPPGARKLGCSKDPGGCSRCAREGVRCVYSPQKRMGRPKKKRLVEKGQPDEPSLPWGMDGSKEGGLPQPYSPNLSAFGGPIPSYNPLELMPNLDMPFTAGSQLQVPTDSFFDIDMSLFQSTDMGCFDPAGENDGPCSDVELTRGSVHRIFEAIGTYVFSKNNGTADHPPDTSEASSLTETAAPATNKRSKAFPNASCPCLSSIYLALDSLTSIPDNIPAAIAVARKASKTAHDVIQCPVCSLPLTEDPLSVPPFQSQQNMFLLSALLSSLSNAYTRLLELVDTATAEASSESRHIHFSFRELGSPWAKVPDSEGGVCMLSRGINETDLPPQLWRLAIQAVIRYEIYGLCTDTDDALCAGDGGNTGHLGLARALRRLEERSIKRHEMMDKLYEDGVELPSGPPYAPTRMENGQRPQCLQVIDCVRVTLDKLVIS